MTTLRTQNLSLAMAGRTLCTDLQVTFRPGENWVILGANGSGKTTLLHTLAGLRAPDRGQVTLNNRDIQEIPPRERAKQIGILFQDFEAVFPATVMDTVLTGRHPHLDRWQWEGAEDCAIGEAALVAMGLAGFAHRPLNTLSGGEHRRVEIAALLAQETPILLLDEPTNHLDLKHQTQVLTRLTTSGHGAEHLTVSVLHDINLARRFGSHALLLFGDGASQHGPVSDVMNRETLERLYQCPLREIRAHDDLWFLPG